MKKTILLIALTIATGALFAQKKTTTSGTIIFDATTSLDALPKADNKTVIAAIDTKSGSVAFEAIIKSFTFGNPMMQEHFNGPKWLDSEKFPKATFKGKIDNLADVNFSTDGTYTANLTGDLTLHGISKPLTATAIITVKDGAINTSANFTINLEDYAIGTANGKVAKEPKIAVNADFK